MRVAKILTDEIEENTGDSGEEMSQYQYDLRVAQTRQGGDLVRNRPESGEYRLKTLIPGTPRADL